MSAGEVAVDVEAVDLSALDWDVACEYSDHSVYGDGPAVWVVHLAASPCCGGEPEVVRYFCDPCWTWRSDPRPVTCDFCEAEVPALSDVLRVERLRPPP